MSDMATRDRYNARKRRAKRRGDKLISAPAGFRKKFAAAAARLAKTKGPLIVGVEMGEAIAIEYRRDGKGYRHEFKRRPKLARSRDGKHLFVSPVKAGTWIEDYKP